MSVEIRRVGTVDVIAPQGPLTEDDAEAFIETLQARLDTANPRFVIDMSAVPYLDSRGIEGIVDAADDLRQRGGRMRLASAMGTCREVLDLTGHAGCVEFFDDTQSAVRSFL